MWDYTEKVKDHFFNPRNVGIIPDADGKGDVGSLSCGDALTFTFKLDESKERIVDAQFKTFGCASAIASSSALTEMVIGKTLEQVLQITNQDIADFLGGLPDEKMHCSVMGREALEAAVDNYRTGKTGQKAVNEDVVCKCFGVTREAIERVIRENDLKDVEDVTHYIKAGGGCGECIPDIEMIIDRVRGAMGATAVAEAPPKKKLTNLQRIALIQDVMDTRIRPALHRDGGDAELIDIDGTRVIVALHGACASCAVSENTLRDVVQARLRQEVDSDIVVEQQKG